MFDSSIAYAAQTFSVPESWIRAVIDVESSWNPNAYNPNDPTGAWGLMQLLYRTAQGLGYTGAPDGLFDPATNIYYGTKLLGQLRVQYGDDFKRVYSAYNSGNPDLWESSQEVYANVMRAMDALAYYLEQAGPVAVATGGAGLLIIGLLIWLFSKRGF